VSGPLVCAHCGQRGDRWPGFTVERYPEAVGFFDGEMLLVTSFRCRNCGTLAVVPAGTVEVRKP